MRGRSIRQIELTRGEVAAVDDCDYNDLVAMGPWQCSGDGYAEHSVGRGGVFKKIMMHRLILERMGFSDFARSDHINRVRLDNRRSNLRPATASQSCCNRAKFKESSSKYIGVCWYKKYQKWVARIQVAGKRQTLGYFNDPQDAARAYNKAAKKLHGKFATLNEV